MTNFLRKEKIMLFAQVSEQGQKELKTALNEAQDAKWYRRLKVIDLSAQGHQVPVLAELFDLNEASVRRYIKQYNEGGLAKLQPGKSSGRQASIPLSKAEWEELLARRPSQFESLQTKARNWSQPLLQRYLSAYHQVEVGQGTISSTLKRHGISWKRAKKK
jgi:transposase